MDELEQLKLQIAELLHQLKTCEAERDLLAIMLTEVENPPRNRREYRLDEQTAPTKQDQPVDQPFQDTKTESGGGKNKIEEKLARQSKLLCAFCGKGQAEVTKLIAGPGVYICDQCVNVCNQTRAGSLPASTKITLCAKASGNEPWCAFCMKSQAQVFEGKMLAGRNVFICCECVDLCDEILDETLFDKPTDSRSKSAVDKLAQESPVTTTTRVNEHDHNYTQKIVDSLLDVQERLLDCQEERIKDSSIIKLLTFERDALATMLAEATAITRAEVEEQLRQFRIRMKTDEPQNP